MGINVIETRHGVVGSWDADLVRSQFEIERSFFLHRIHFI